MPSVNDSLYLSVVISLRAMPTTRISGPRWPLQKRLHNEGVSLRLVRSPDAPKVTMVVVCPLYVSSEPTGLFRLPDGMTAKLVSQCRQQPPTQGLVLPRPEPGLQS